MRVSLAIKVVCRQCKQSLVAKDYLYEEEDCILLEVEPCTRCSGEAPKPSAQEPVYQRATDVRVCPICKGQKSVIVPATPVTPDRPMTCGYCGGKGYIQLLRG